MITSETALQTRDFSSLEEAEVAKLLNTNAEQGLTEKEAKERLSFFGRNTFEKSKAPGIVRILFNQFKSPLILILIVAGIITLSITHYRDSVFIFIAVAANALLGFFQEYKAERALSELKTYLKQRARVVRNNTEREVAAEELVPGDLIRLSQGDRVPADARIVFVNDLQVDESILTGESLPVLKTPNKTPSTLPLADQSAMIFAGTLITQGICSALICRTDENTEIGKIASLLEQSDSEKTPLQKAILLFSLKLSALLCLLTAGVFVIGIISGKPILEMFLTSVAIAVSAIPEGLPVSMTVILAIGVERMAKRKGVVRKLIAAETLGSTNIILTDKTGTLTKAHMVMSKVIPRDINEETLIKRALTNTQVLIENPLDQPERWRMSGRIMEAALVRSAALRNFPISLINDKSSILQMIPFNAVQKFSAALIIESGKHLVVAFGAPDILIEHSSLNSLQKEELLASIHELASNGERVLGLASKRVEMNQNYSLSKDSVLENLSFDGLITFRDPVRAGIKNVIKRVHEAGVRTIILTGDHKGTAMAVAKEIGIEVNKRSVLDASELATLSDQALRDKLPFLSVISRVTPLDKLRIAKAYQASGAIVAMTGDGVNDAPSIRQADVGIAMGSGTEVARDVADLVLLNDNFETIVAAIEEGRQILGNIRKVLVYLISNVADGLILIGGSLILGAPLPLNALQILWVNFFSDSLPAIAFAFEKDPDALAHKPHGKTIHLFDPLMKTLVIIIGLSTSALLLVIYLALIELGFEESLVKTFTFAAFGTYTLFAALSVRSLDRSIFSLPLFSNIYLMSGIIIGLLLMAAAIYVPFLQSLFDTTPLPFVWVLGVFLVGILNIILIETTKFFFRRRRKAVISMQ